LKPLRRSGYARLRVDTNHDTADRPLVLLWTRSRTPGWWARTAIRFRLRAAVRAPTPRWFVRATRVPARIVRRKGVASVDNGLSVITTVDAKIIKTKIMIGVSERRVRARHITRPGRCCWTACHGSPGGSAHPHVGVRWRDQAGSARPLAFAW